MSEPIFILVHEVVGGPLCVAAEDGDRLREHIVPALHEGRRVIVSFVGIERVIPAFLSSAIGRLYGEFPDAELERLLEFRDLPNGSEGAVESACRWAKAYYRDPQSYERAITEVLGE
jgi:hypothetical protein